MSTYPGTSARRPPSRVFSNTNVLTPVERSKYDAAVAKWVEGVTSNIDTVENRPDAIDFHMSGKYSEDPGTSARRRPSRVFFNANVLTPDERSNYDAAVAKWVEGVNSHTDEVENRPNAIDFHKGGKKRSCKKRSGKKRSCKKRSGKKRSGKKRSGKKRSCKKRGGKKRSGKNRV